MILDIELGELVQVFENILRVLPVHPVFDIGIRNACGVVAAVLLGRRMRHEDGKAD
jgi:hypothetical protein